MLTAEQPTIGKIVRALRQARGLTQEQFAQKLGVTFPTVNRWENSKATPSPLAMQKLNRMVNRMGGHNWLTQVNSGEGENDKLDTF
ncbi:MAG: helix-turn-helix domain-containing protein [Planktothrix sp.]